MLNEHKSIEAALKEILPTYYELFCDSSTPMPCITYREAVNRVEIQTEVIGYSIVGYYVKVWAKDVKTVQETVVLIDAAMRKLGYHRTSTNELVAERQIEKIMTYEGIGFEKFSEDEE